MMTDWIEHNGGPQPVADDVWVQVCRIYSGHDRSPSMAAGFDWPDSVRSFRILNQHLIDAARLEGIRLGLEAAEKYNRRAFDLIVDALRNTNPETVAKEADNEPR